MNPSNSASSIHRWRRDQYDQMLAADIFDDGDRVELLDGYIVDMSPQTSLHAAVVSLVEDAVRIAFGRAFYIRAQLPLALDDHSQPDPDITVVSGNPRNYLDRHPTTAALVVEIADGSLERDQGLKKTLYARNNIQDYWIVNLNADCLEIYRQPAGDDFSCREILQRGDSIEPLGSTGHSIMVADLLP